MIWTYLLFALGLILIIKGGDEFVDGARWLAAVTGIPKFIIAATVVSFATTLPELLVSTFATAQGSDSIALGNAIGSVACNTGLILGISLLFLPGRVAPKSLRSKGLIMALSTVLLLIFAVNGMLGLWEALILVAVLVVYIIGNLREGREKQDEDRADSNRPAGKEILANTLRIVLGAAALAVGANLLVDNGQLIAAALGVPEVFIAITLVALGTSLPELVTTITSIIKKEPAMSVGNIIGANILDMTFVLAASFGVSGGGLAMEQPGFTLDGAASLLLIAVVLLPSIKTGRFHRWQGAVLLIFYAVFLYLRFQIS